MPPIAERNGRAVMHQFSDLARLAGLALLVDESDLGVLQKQTVNALITQGEENPDQVQAVIGQIREALGL